LSRFDRIDRQLIESLQNNARLSNKELAAKVGLAPSSCLERVRRLIAQGVLRGFHADVDPEALGVKLEAMVAVRLAEHSRATLERFRRQALERQEVLAIYYLAGATDFMIHVAVSSPTHLRDLVLEAFSTPGEVARVETSLIFDNSRRWQVPYYPEVG
jgi:DNA-binding Lrp family transcriptional regulator